MKKRIVIIDDHPIIRQGLARLIDQEEDLAVVGGAEDAPEALALIEAVRPDLALVDLSLKNSSGIELIKTIKTRYPDLLTLVISLYDESVYAERVLRAGARGFIMKAEATEKVMIAIRQVLEGGVFVSDTMRNRLLSSMARGGGKGDHTPTELLSDRELEVFQAIGNGRSTREIASLLNLSIKTIETYKSYLKQKLGLKNSTELMQFAVEWQVSNR